MMTLHGMKTSESEMMMSHGRKIRRIKWRSTVSEQSISVRKVFSDGFAFNTFLLAHNIFLIELQGIMLRLHAYSTWDTTLTSEHESDEEHVRIQLQIAWSWSLADNMHAQDGVQWVCHATLLHVLICIGNWFRYRFDTGTGLRFAKSSRIQSIFGRQNPLFARAKHRVPGESYTSYIYLILYDLPSFCVLYYEWLEIDTTTYGSPDRIGSGFQSDLPKMRTRDPSGGVRRIIACIVRV